MNRAALQIEQTGLVATVWLSRPAVHNAFDAALIAELARAFINLGEDHSIRAIVLASQGRSFSAGADLTWMKEQGEASPEANLEDAKKLGEMFRIIAECPKPTLARVQGAAIGGGVGLVAACDIAIGSDQCTFAMSEVRLGLVPATIAPYLVRAIGARQARRLFQTGERFDAATAVRIGLLHEAVQPEALDSRLQTIVDALMAGAPGAQRDAKRLVQVTASGSTDETVLAQMAGIIAERRATVEAREGLSAFLEKRSAHWVPRP